jgi:hypothetical protein
MAPIDREGEPRDQSREPFNPEEALGEEPLVVQDIEGIQISGRDIAPVVPGRIFISYRRDDADYPASWLDDRLVARFGRDQVFKDVDSIELGDDFAEAITKAVGACDVLLALIGPQWLTVKDEAGNRRLDKPDDFVRLEIEVALERKVRVIPILIGNATMPRGDQVPASLAKLVRRQALQLSPNRFGFDLGRLLPVLDKTLAEQQAKREDEEYARRQDERNRNTRAIWTADLDDLNGQADS